MGSAIDRLAQAVKRNSPHLEIQVFPVHPKRNDVEVIIEAQKLMMWADIIDIHYWKSGEILRTSFPQQFNEKPRILFHFNPYDAGKEEVNKNYNLIAVGNQEIQDKIPYAYLIPYAVDTAYFRYNENYTQERVVNMSVARIEGKKGVKQVAQACRELGYKLRLVGRISKGGYMREVMQVGGDAIEFWENATEEKLKELYYGAAIHVCNSVDGFESGTLPILESMLCGLPVLTRNVGHVPDLYNGKNMVVRSGNVEDVEDIKKHLKEMMENREWRLKLRENGWDTVRTRDDRVMAHSVRKLYYMSYKKQLESVSVIIPTKDNPDSFVKCLVGVLDQDYGKYEIVVADSGEASLLPVIEKIRTKTDIPIKYVHFPHKDNYTLGEARNRAVLEAEGNYLVFCDDRLKMERNAISEFMQNKREKRWLWGQKDGVAKSFVENFSCVKREDLVNGGMFTERIQWYGGMTQEVRTRFERGRGFQFVYVQKAEANSVKRASSKKGRRSNIIEAKWVLQKMYE